MVAVLVLEGLSGSKHASLTSGHAGEMVGERVQLIAAEMAN